MTEDSSNLRKTSSMAEWQNYGERLTRLHHELVTLLVDAGQTVPRSELEDLEKALERVDTARSDLEGRMTREHDPDEWDLDVFYGGIPEDYTGWRDVLNGGDEGEWLWSEEDVTGVPCPWCGESDRVGLNRTNVRGDKRQSPHKYRCYRCECGFDSHGDDQ